MSAALQRRDEGCASDLLMDRWLLGELPGSDEGRRFEQHLRECTGCAARFQSLRSLYGNAPAPRAEAPAPPLRAPPPVIPPEHAAVLQVVILRDGLLVGTEVFTAGRYTVGCDPSCALRLDDVAPVHAALSLTGARVGLEAAGGPLFVNGFRATSCELRPIDEVAVGPYVLRARVIAERWQRTKLQLVEPERPAVDAPPPVALKLQLYWGDTRVEVRILDTPGDLSAFGITSVQPIDGGWALDGLRVARGEVQRFHVGHLVCVAECVPREAAVPAKPLREWPWAVTGLASALFAGVIALGIYGANVEEPDFVPKEIPKAMVHAILTPPASRPPAAVQPPREPPKCATGPGRKHARPTKVVPALVARDAIANVLDSLGKLGKQPGGKRGRAVVGLGAAAVPAAFDFHTDALGTGIGARGFKGAGDLKPGTVGKGRVVGTLGAASARGVKAAKHTPVDRDAIAKVINSHLGELSRCYEQAMMSTGSFGGRLHIEWTISPSGTVTQSRVKDTDIKNASVGACVLGHLNGWRFPAGRGPSIVSYPLMFQSVGY